MLEDKRIFEEINSYIAILHHAIKQKGSIGFNDDKVACEDLFKGIFNIMYDLDLMNVNSIQANYPAIDLGDSANGVCYQITFENTASKIKETIEKYHNHEIHKKYPTLYIFIYDDKPKSRKTESNVIYKQHLIVGISQLSFSKKKAILEFLKKNINLYREAKKSIEIQTIQMVIKHLCSSQKIDSPDDLEDKPYPEEKLELRFGGFKECIKEEYGELYADYNGVLHGAKEDYIDEGNSKKIKNYLRRASREKLFEEKGDAKSALNSLIEDIENSIDFDIYHTALRFYILSELMDCDIFPLSKTEAEKIRDIHDNSI